jgi:ATP-dependent Clp protease ATP-binding subunit ClpB
VLLQVLDDGRLTDGQGHTVDFRNTIIVLTSNLGSEFLAGLAEDQDVSTVRAEVMDAVRGAFRPEFINRLDEILIFRRLSREDMTGIVDIQLAHLRKLLTDRRIALEVDDAAKRWVADQGYSPVYGARPLKRLIQRELQNPLAERLLKGEIRDGDTVRVTATPLGLVIAPVPQPGTPETRRDAAE